MFSMGLFTCREMYPELACLGNPPQEPDLEKEADLPEEFQIRSFELDSFTAVWES